jgi:hypothetical protein
MRSNSLILLGIGLFASLVFAITVVDEYLLEGHDPLEPAGLIWHVKAAFSRVGDLEALLEITESGREEEPLRLLVRFLNAPDAALSVRYLEPEALRDELFTVDRDLLRHYQPEENLIVSKRWIGLPLAEVGLANLNFFQLERDWKAGKITLRVVQEISGFGAELFLSSISLSGESAECSLAVSNSNWLELGVQDQFYISDLTGLQRDISGITLGDLWGGRAKISFCSTGEEGVEGQLPDSSIRGGYVLEITDAASGELAQMIWIDRDTYFVQKVVFFSEGRRTTSIQLERLTLDQGLTREEILILPRAEESIRG